MSTFPAAQTAQHTTIHALRFKVIQSKYCELMYTHKHQPTGYQ